MAEYRSTVRWDRLGQDFINNKYSRAHLWSFDGGAQVQASSSPHIVPLPLSIESNVDPEEALIASVSSCHMLFFLSIAAKKQFIVDSYEDHAVGLMAKNADNKLAITRIGLRPCIRFSGDKQPTQGMIDKMHHLAHEQCFIANSVTATIVVESVE